MNDVVESEEKDFDQIFTLFNHLQLNSTVKRIFIEVTYSDNKNYVSSFSMYVILARVVQTNLRWILVLALCAS